MRLPRFRFTVRRMMLIVALAAATIFAVKEISRLRGVSAKYRDKAELCAMIQARYLSVSKLSEDSAIKYASQADEAAKRLDHVIAKGIKPEYDMSNPVGVEVELLRSGIPQAETERYRSAVRRLESTIRYAREAEKRFRSAARSEALRFRPVVEYYTRLRLKYERAARYPWLAVEPDPPVPKYPYK